LTFPDGETSAIWANSRLWNAYRATAVMPGVLESALMALEAWLLELIQLDGWESAIQKWLVWILRHSNNVCSIAVVASVCIAHPTKTMDAGLILLSCREFFHLIAKGWCQITGHSRLAVPRPRGRVQPRRHDTAGGAMHAGTRGLLKCNDLYVDTLLLSWNKCIRLRK
jgi:hypothetical protein